MQGQQTSPLLAQSVNRPAPNIDQSISLEHSHEGQAWIRRGSGPSAPRRNQFAQPPPHRFGHLNKLDPDVVALLVIDLV